MPKITFISPDTYPKKRIGGTLLYKHGDNFRTRTVKTYRKRKTYFYTKSNMTFAQAAAAWLFTTIAQYMNWLDYQPNVKKSRSPRNAFMANNIQIIHHYLPGTVPVMDITIPPENPDLPTCIEAWFDAENNQCIFTWKEDYPIEIYIAMGVDETSYRYVMPSERYRIRGAEIAIAETAYVSGDWFIAGTKAHVAIRACNDRGEVSPWSDAIEIEVPEKPTADFTGTPRRGPVPLEVVFNDLTEGDISSWLWSFGDGEFSDEQHPIHTYKIDTDYFNVKLTAFGIADSKNSLTRYKYIKIGDQSEDVEFFFVSDTNNDRIFKRYTDKLTFKSKFGTHGSGNEQFNHPFGICIDNLYVYVCDEFNNRVSKFVKWNYYFMGKYDYAAPDPKHIYIPKGVTVDDDYGYIGDFGNDRIVKFTKETMAYHSERVKFGAFDDTFNGPHGVAVDDNHLFVCDMFKNRIIKFDKDGLWYDSKIGSSGSGEDQFDHPCGIAVDRQFIYIADLDNHRIVKRYKSSLGFKQAVGSQGSGDAQFNYPIDVAVGAVHLYVADRNNHRIVKLLKEDLSFVRNIGTEGSGDDQFNYPRGIGIMSTYSYS